MRYKLELKHMILISQNSFFGSYVIRLFNKPKNSEFTTIFTTWQSF